MAAFTEVSTIPSLPVRLWLHVEPLALLPGSSSTPGSLQWLKAQPLSLPRASTALWWPPILVPCSVRPPAACLAPSQPILPKQWWGKEGCPVVGQSHPLGRSHPWALALLGTVLQGPCEAEGDGGVTCCDTPQTPREALLWWGRVWGCLPSLDHGHMAPWGVGQGPSCHTDTRWTEHTHQSPAATEIHWFTRVLSQDECLPASPGICFW